MIGFNPFANRRPFHRNYNPFPFRPHQPTPSTPFVKEFGITAQKFPIHRDPNNNNQFAIAFHIGNFPMVAIISLSNPYTTIIDRFALPSATYDYKDSTSCIIVPTPRHDLTYLYCSNINIHTFPRQNDNNGNQFIKVYDYIDVAPYSQYSPIQLMVKLNPANANPNLQNILGLSPNNSLKIPYIFANFPQNYMVFQRPTSPPKYILDTAPKTAITTNKYSAILTDMYYGNTKIISSNALTTIFDSELDGIMIPEKYYKNVYLASKRDFILIFRGSGRDLDHRVRQANNVKKVYLRINCDKYITPPKYYFWNVLGYKVYPTTQNIIIIGNIIFDNLIVGFNSENSGIEIY